MRQEQELEWHWLCQALPVLFHAPAARLLLGDTPFALQVDLLAHASVIAVARKQSIDWKPYHVQGCSIASVLTAKYSQYAWGGEVTSFHCLAAGDFAGAEKALLPLERPSIVPFRYFSFLSCRLFVARRLPHSKTGGICVSIMRRPWDSLMESRRS